MIQNFVIVCESAIIEKDTSNLYILGTFDNVIAQTVPTIQQKFSIVTNFKDGDGEHKHKILIRHEGGGEIAVLEGKISFGSTKKAQYIGKFIGVPFEKFGKYIIEIYVDNILQPLTGELNVIQKK